jgi:hypothetical protein
VSRCIMMAAGLALLAAANAGGVQAQQSVGVSVTVPERPVWDDIRWEVHGTAAGVALRGLDAAVAGDSRVLRHTYVQAQDRPREAVALVVSGTAARRSAATGRLGDAARSLVITRSELRPGTHRLVVTRVLAANS